MILIKLDQQQLIPHNQWDLFLHFTIKILQIFLLKKTYRQKNKMYINKKLIIQLFYS